MILILIHRNNYLVPAYEVVPVAHGISMGLKNNRIIHFISFKQNITLYLKPTDGYLAGVKTPVFKARSNSKEESGIEYQQIYDVSFIFQCFYEKCNMFSLFLSCFR